MNVFYTSETYTIPAAGQVEVQISSTFKLISVVMALDASAPNVFKIQIDRGGVTYQIYRMSVTSQWISWLLEGGGIVLESGDVLRFINSANQEGHVWYSYETHGPAAPTITVTPGPVVSEAKNPVA